MSLQKRGAEVLRGDYSHVKKQAAKSAKPKKQAAKSGKSAVSGASRSTAGKVKKSAVSGASRSVAGKVSATSGASRSVRGKTGAAGSVDQKKAAGRRAEADRNSPRSNGTGRGPKTRNAKVTIRDKSKKKMTGANSRKASRGKIGKQAQRPTTGGTAGRRQRRKINFSGK